MIYVLQDEATLAVKVGFSRNPKGRVAALRTASPHRLRMLGLIEGDAGLERSIHRDLQRHRLSGEWFEATPEVAAYLAELFRARAGSIPYCRALTAPVARGPPRRRDRSGGGEGSQPPRVSRAVAARHNA